MNRRIIHISQTDSTNRYLHDLRPEGEEMTVVVADYQTAGRGQGSNSWESEPGKNLLMSIRVYPTMVGLPVVPDEACTRIISLCGAA